MISNNVGAKFNKWFLGFGFRSQNFPNYFLCGRLIYYSTFSEAFSCPSHSFGKWKLTKMIVVAIFAEISSKLMDGMRMIHLHFVCHLA